MKGLAFDPEAVSQEARDIVRRFCTPRSRVLSGRKTRLLERAKRLSIDTPCGPVVGYDWESDSPEKPVVILGHGWSDCAATWSAFIAPLRNAGFRPIAFDQPAHGATAQLNNLDETIFPRFTLATEALIRWAARQGSVKAVLGHSAGALAAFLASTTVAAERTVMIAMPKDVNWFIDGFIDSQEFTESVRIEFRQHLRYRFHEDLGSEAEPDVMDSVALAPEVKAPCLFIQDTDDEEVDLEDSVAAVDALRKAGKPVERFDTVGLGHQLILRSPVVVDKVLDYLC